MSDRLLKSTALCMITAFSLGAAQAQPMQVSGPHSSYAVSGVPISCGLGNGQVVPIYLDPTLNDVGMATIGNANPRIIVNPNILERFSPIVKVWWLAHECGHTLLPLGHSEAEADCRAASVMRTTGILNHPSQLDAFANELSSLPASARHLPGWQRVQVIASCAFG